MIVQPIIGHYSDRTWTKLGSRRPYFLIGIGAVIGAILLFVLTNWFGMENVPQNEGGVAPNVKLACYMESMKGLGWKISSAECQNTNWVIRTSPIFSLATGLPLTQIKSNCH